MTLPLVEMAEMDRPVMEVTVTDSRMMIQVRTVGRGGAGGDVVTPKLSRGISQVKEPREKPCKFNHCPSLSLCLLIRKMGLCLPPWSIRELLSQHGKDH